MLSKLIAETQSWESDRLEDIAEAIAETGKPRIPAKVSVIEVTVVRRFYEPVGWDIEGYIPVDHEVIGTYHIG